MARIVDCCPASDDELPDVPVLAQKPVDDRIRASRMSTAPALKSPEKTLVPKSPSKSVRKIRRLDNDSAAHHNPLFQPWNSDADDISRLSGSPTKRSPRKSRLMGEQSFLSTDASIFDVDVKPRMPRLNPLRLSRARVTSGVIDESEDSLGSLTAFSIKADSVRDGPSSTTLEQGDDSSVSEARPEQTPDVSQPEQCEEDDEEADPARQLQLEASIYAERSTNDSEVSASADAEDTSSGSFEEPTSASDSDGLDKPPNKISSSAKLLFAPSRSPGSLGSPPNSKQTDSVLQPRHTNVLGRSAEPSDDDIFKSKPSMPMALSPTKLTSPEKRQRLRIASQATAADLADSLKELRLQIDEDSDKEKRKQKSSKTPLGTPPHERKTKGLLSPTKLARIPKTPHRPSVDAFWSQEFVNDWNDQHSPRKLNLPPVGKKSPVKSSPSKETKKTFDSKKLTLAEEFLLDLDTEITQGKIAELAEQTGGIKIIWTKTLNTTAGRANWKRETIRTKRADGTQISVQYKHHASIELAEKVIDNEERLLNVLAHEFCHLATFMMDGIANNPHGKEFKAWAAKCTKAFGDRGVNVTTKHSYDIDFKYMWQCTACGSDYKRHSRSIDPKRHRCGSCKGQLKQTKPVPRQSKSQQPSEYQVFVRENMKLVREENPGISQKEVMKHVAERWAKKKKEIEADTTVADATAVDATLAETTLADATVAETTVADATQADATSSSDASVNEVPVAGAEPTAPVQESSQVDEEAAKVDTVVEEMVDLTLKDQETQ